MELVLDGTIRVFLLFREISPLRLQVDRGAHLEVRPRRVAFGIENVERISFTLDQLQTRIVLADGIQVHGAFFGVMAAADIHHQAVVNKHPHVVIAAELEILSLHVLELRRHLHGVAVVVLAALMFLVLVVLRVRNLARRIRRIEILEIVNRIETRMQGIAAGTIERLRNVGQPETFLVHGQVDIATDGILVLVAVHHNRFGNKPRLDFMGRRAHSPRIHRRIHAGRRPVHQGILHHPLHKASAFRIRSQRAQRIKERHRGVVVAIINPAEIHVDIVIERFTRPVDDHRRNLHRGTNPEHLGVSRRNTERNRRHPHRIRLRKNGIQVDQLARDSI